LKAVLLLVLVQVILSSHLQSSLTLLSGTTVKFTVENPSSNDVKFLKWGTPLDVEKDMFVIMGPSKNKAVYTGILVQRTEPTDEDFITLRPNQRISEEIDLSKYFEFSETGYTSVNLDFSPFVELSKPQEKVLVYIEASLSKKSREVINSIVDLENGPSVMNVNCNSADTVKVNTGKSLGSRYANCGRNCLNARSCNTLYTTWFGALDGTRYAAVTRNFGAIVNGFSANFPSHYRPSANCASNIIAYVYPSDRSRTVYLCPLYFQRSDADAGHTMLHEVAHFDSIAGTRDHCYGRTACQNLARTNPALAVACADNHAFHGMDCR